ncbi:SH3 domain-containing protein [Nitratireductor thuwali]|uniref:Uncharacterized protein n=1 Tax=Nitratireductor thuwali TaxID=2267699 RepID=A0ABY5MIK3_9HYPH|nr:hypothetical protein NTH_01539 [Nitratireductor thuwali]
MTRNLLLSAAAAVAISIPAMAQTQMWTSVDSANRRTCPSSECGSVGTLFYRESAKVFETRNGWSRVSQYYDAACSGGRSAYVDSGRADCTPINGIVGGQFAEWVRSDLLAAQRPADPSVGATGTAKLIGQSDDFRLHRDAFVKATDELIASGRCRASDFEE